MAAVMLRVEVATATEKKLLDLARVGPFEHWIIPGWQRVPSGRCPLCLIRLEGLPFTPGGVGAADYTVHVTLSDQVLAGETGEWGGAQISVLDGLSPEVIRMKIPRTIPDLPVEALVQDASPLDV